jgi:hypothetical protein
VEQGALEVQRPPEGNLHSHAARNRERREGRRVLLGLLQKYAALARREPVRAALEHAP